MGMLLSGLTAGLDLWFGPLAIAVVLTLTEGTLASPLQDLLSAIAAGWLMGLLAWLISAARETTSQIIIVWLTTGIIGLSKMHHSIAGSIEVLMSVFSGGATVAEYGRFLALAVAGNAVGGACFVGALKFSAVQRSVT